jgi:tetratricopeptide (TPR) repeat protein
VLHEELRSQIRQRLSGDLHRLARKFHEAGNAGIAKRLERLDLRCDDEIETAKAMLAAKLNTNRGNLCAGKLLLDRLELTNTVSSSVESALQRLPGDRNLTFLRQALGSYSEIWFLLRRDQFDLAMEAIDRLSSEQRKASEVRTLECKALQGQGSQLAALGKVSEALDRWELALAKADSGEERESIRDKIEKSLGEVAAKVSGQATLGTRRSICSNVAKPCCRVRVRPPARISSSGSPSCTASGVSRSSTKRKKSLTRIA